MDGRGGGDDDHFIAANSTVTVADATDVTAEGQTSATPAHTIAEISVGSLIDAFGTASKDNSGKVTLDATAGRVRLDLTRVQGALRASGTGNITLNLKAIDRRPVSLFSFTGTGSANGADSDPTKYVVGTGALDLGRFSVGESVLSIGFVNPFGKAPPDFKAVTVASFAIGGNDNCDGNNNCMCNDDNSGRGSGDNNCMCNGDNSGPGSGDNNCMCNGDNSGPGSGDNNNCPNNANHAASAELDIDWGNSGTTKPFKTLSATKLDLDVKNPSIGSHHEIETNPQDLDLESLATNVSITGAGSGMTLFSITGQHGRETRNFGSFADFEAALAADLDGTTTALRLTAEGVYDAAGNSFTAQRITILLSN
jgi:hypothetical protein